MTRNLEEKIMLPEEVIMSRILYIRGYKVIIDRDLAELYDVPTKRLNEQVKRNIRRFPEHFIFELTIEEKEWRETIISMALLIFNCYMSSGIY